MAGNQVEGSYVTGDVIQIGPVTGNVTLVSDQASFRLELLTPVPLPKRLPRSQHTPSYLLDAQRQIVPYRPRPTLEKTLTEWRDDDEPISVRLVSGAGGAGKTRLAGWFATASHAEGSTVLLASDKTMPLPPATRNQNLPKGGNLLVVADYAERWPLESLRTMVETVAARQREADDGRVRVLLLARPQLGFWDGVKAQLGRAWVDLAEPLSMDAFITGGDDLREAFTSASGAFQKSLGIPVSPVPVPAGLPPTDVSPLTLHMAALAAVCATDEGDPVPGGDDLSAFLLGHERRYWQTTKPGEKAMATTVLVATLFGPVATHDRAVYWLTRAHQAANDAEAARLIAAHAHCYPPADSAAGLLSPLKPDRFAEDFLAEHLKLPRASDLLTGLLTGDAEAHELRQAFTVLSSSAARHTATRESLFGLLDTWPIPPAWLSPVLLDVVTAHAPDQLAAAVEEAVPIHRTDLLRPALALSERLIQRLPTDATPAVRAYRLNSLGLRRAGVGDQRAALAPIQEAIDIFCGLAETQPGANLPNVATCLSNLGVFLADVGDKPNALAATDEAVGIHRRLAESDPDTYDAELAASLNNLGNRLADIGDKPKALAATEEGTDILRRLADAEPGTYLPDLAKSLSNLGLRRISVGDEKALEPAREAVRIRRSLAEADPDTYDAELAASLNNLGDCLAKSGDTPAAPAPTREAVQILQRLAETEPDTYLPDLALALNNLGVRLADVGDKEALERAQEAAGLYRRLAETEPGAHLPELAMSLWANARVRSTLGVEHSKALKCVEEAIALYEDLAVRLPQAYKDRLEAARSLRDAILNELGC